ncbi:hypothetical protein EPO15_08740 [bacterium]|nr:MAG: hypothetical protein EPO15_08740 [bacterium]
MAPSRALASLCAAALLAVPAARASEVPPVVGVPVPPPAREGAAAREDVWVKGLAQLYGTSEGLVRSLRTLGLDHVETECAVAVSTRAQRPVAEVLELRKAGMEWGDIARSYGFSLLEAVREAPAVRRRSAPPARERSRP